MNRLLTTPKKNLKIIKISLKQQSDFFDEREQYKEDVKKAISKYGIANLPKVVLETLPNDMRDFYEKHWRKQPKVWLIMLKTALVAADKGVEIERTNEHDANNISDSDTE